MPSESKEIARLIELGRYEELQRKKVSFRRLIELSAEDSTLQQILDNVSDVSQMLEALDTSDEELLPPSTISSVEAELEPLEEREAEIGHLVQDVLLDQLAGVDGVNRASQEPVLFYHTINATSAIINAYLGPDAPFGTVVDWRREGNVCRRHSDTAIERSTVSRGREKPIETRLLSQRELTEEVQNYLNLDDNDLNEFVLLVHDGARLVERLLPAFSSRAERDDVSLTLLEPKERIVNISKRWARPLFHKKAQV